MDSIVLIRVFYIFLVGYCLYLIIKEQIDYNKARWFLLESENIKLYNATIRLVKNEAIDRGNPDLVDVLLEINNLDEFDNLKKRDREFIVGIIMIIERDKEELIDFFRWRGDI